MDAIDLLLFSLSGVVFMFLCGLVGFFAGKYHMKKRMEDILKDWRSPTLRE